MEGSITQLGLSNYLINNKNRKESFFKHGYKNYSNFVKATTKIPFNNFFNFGQTAFCKINEMAKYGDLINNITIEVKLPKLTGNYGWCNGIGNALCKSIELRIGGNLIDRHTSEWMDIWSDLNIVNSNKELYNELIKKKENHQYDTYQGGGILYIPLHFWFCQNKKANSNNNLILPITALLQNDIEIRVNIRTFNELVISLDDTLPEQINIIDANLIIDFIVLETEERLKYKTLKLQYFLITQVQTLTFNIDAGTKNTNISLRELKYPVSELFWIVQSNDTITNKKYFNYGKNSLEEDQNPISAVEILFENKVRVSEMNSDYFCKLEPFKIHNNFPSSFVHLYGFALDPENIGQPSGICNFSELHAPSINFKFEDVEKSTLTVFAINYNILQIDNLGNAWLLHNLSKSVPSQFPSEYCKDKQAKKDEKEKALDNKYNISNNANNARNNNTNS